MLGAREEWVNIMSAGSIVSCALRDYIWHYRAEASHMSVILLINVVVATAVIVYAFTRPYLKSGAVMLLVSGLLMLMFICGPPMSSITAPAVDKNGDLITDKHGKPVYSADFV